MRSSPVPPSVATMSEGTAAEFRWWCAYCDRSSEASFETRRAAHEAGLAHIQESDHGLTTILTPEAE